MAKKNNTILASKIESTKSNVKTYEHIISQNLVALRQKLDLIEKGDTHLISTLPQIVNTLVSHRMLLELTQNHLLTLEELTDK